MRVSSIKIGGGSIQRIDNSLSCYVFLLEFYLNYLPFCFGDYDRFFNQICRIHNDVSRYTDTWALWEAPSNGNSSRCSRWCLSLICSVAVFQDCQDHSGGGKEDLKTPDCLSSRIGHGSLIFPEMGSFSSLHDHQHGFLGVGVDSRNQELQTREGRLLSYSAIVRSLCFVTLNSDSWAFGLTLLAG